MPTFISFYRLLQQANQNKQTPHSSHMSIYDSDFIEPDPSPLATQSAKFFAELDGKDCSKNNCGQCACQEDS